MKAKQEPTIQLDTLKTNDRIHHKINWRHCAPKILREEWRKGGSSPTPALQSPQGKE